MKKEPLLVICNAFIQIGIGTNFFNSDKSKLMFEHCTFYSLVLTSKNLVAKIKNEATYYGCLFCGYDHKMETIIDNCKPPKNTKSAKIKRKV